MKHQQAILNQRLENMKSGVEQAEKFLWSLSGQIEAVKEVNLEDLKNELLEIQDFLTWVKNQ